MKKFLASLLCVMMVVCFMPSMAWAEEAVENCPNGDSCTEHAAVIGNSHYKTLEDAISVANTETGDVTVTMLNDVVLSKDLQIGSGNSNHTITMDLNGKNIDGGTAFQIYTAGNASVELIGSGTIKNEKTSNPKSAYDAPLRIYDGTTVILDGINVVGDYCAVKNSGNLTVKKGIITGTTFGIGCFGSGTTIIGMSGGSNDDIIVKAQEQALCTAANTGQAGMNVTVNGGLFTTTGKEWDDCPAYWAGHGTLNIYGGTFRNETSGTGAAALLQKNGTVNVYGGSFQSKDGIKLVAQSDSTEMTTYIEGGEFTGTRSGIYIDASNSTNMNGLTKYSVTISNGVSVPKFTGETEKGLYSKENGLGSKKLMTVSGGTFIGETSTTISSYLDDDYMFDETTCTVVEIPPVAEINGNQYTTLSQAIKDAKDGSIVKLLRDVNLSDTVTIKSNITLDLNTYTISSKKGSVIFQNEGSSSLVVKDGTITNTSDGKVFVWSGDGELTLTNAKITAEKARAIQIEGNAAVTVDKDSVITGNDHSIYIRGSSQPKLKIYGIVTAGEFEAIVTNPSDGTPIIEIYDGAKVSSDEWAAIWIQKPTILKIYGGTIEGGKDVALLGEKENDEEPNVQVGLHPETFVKGGNFIGDIVIAENTHPFITGGTFSSDVLKYVVEGYNEYKYSDDKYVVTSTAPVNSSGYNTWTKGEDGIYTESYAAPSVPPVTPTAPSDNVTNSGASGTDNATTTADININVSADGTADAVVDQTTADKIIDKATSNQSTEVVIDATTAAGKAESTTITVPTETVQQIVEKLDADVTVKTDAAEMTLDQTAINAIASQAAGSNLKIIVEKTKDETTQMHFELKVVSNGVVIGDFKGGNVKVTVKLNEALKSLSEKNLVCVYIDDAGKYTKIGGVKNSDGTYTFTTTHFSSYAIMAEDEADKIISDQNEALIEAVKSFKLVARSANAKAPSGKKAIKVTWFAKDGSELNFDGYEIYRSTKKNSGYGTKPIYKTTKSLQYFNTSAKKGTRYYYKVRGYKMIGGEKVYTPYSLKAIRTAK